MTTVSTPVRARLGRVRRNVRDRRSVRLDRSELREQLVAYRTASELSELSAIADRNEHVDTAQLRTVLAQQLSR